LYSICTVCGRRYSGLNCLKCTQQAIYVGTFGEETLGVSTKAASSIVAKAPLSRNVAKLKSVGDGQMYAVPRPTCRIGQDSSNDIVILDDETTAKYHAQITYDEKESEYFLRDLGTQGGTYLNGLQVYLDQAIFNGDMIKIGKYKFYFIE
jgi:pSer/pThr/pTyr-binding forkhead associated (FHA) protein